MGWIMDFSELKDKLASRIESLFFYRSAEGEEAKKKAKRNLLVVSAVGACAVAAVSTVLLAMSCAYSDVTEVSGEDRV